MRLFPQRKYWLWILLGFIIDLLFVLVVGLPLIGILVASLVLAFVAPGRGGKLRKFFMFLFWIAGFEFALLGVLVALGSTVLGVAAMNAAFTVTGWVLGLILIAFGIVLFIIGNLIQD